MAQRDSGNKIPLGQKTAWGEKRRLGDVTSHQRAENAGVKKWMAGGHESDDGCQRKKNGSTRRTMDVVGWGININFQQ